MFMGKESTFKQAIKDIIRQMVAEAAVGQLGFASGSAAAGDFKALQVWL